ncbi:PE family protein, partial [Mycobacterium szulgai]
MSFVMAAPQVLETAATDLASLGSALSAANAAAAAPITALSAAAEDEVSLAIAALFSGHAEGYQALSAQATAFHQRFVQALTAGASAYASAEAANASPLQALLDAVNAPSQALTGRPLIGNGANAAPGTGNNGGDAGWLLGDGGAGGSGTPDTVGTGGGTGGRGGAAGLFGSGGAGGAGGYSAGGNGGTG